MALVSFPHHLPKLSMIMVLPLIVATFVMITDGGGPVPKLRSHLSKGVSERTETHIAGRGNKERCQHKGDAQADHEGLSAVDLIPNGTRGVR